MTLALVLKAGAQPCAKPPVQLVPDHPAGGDVTVICFAVERVPEPKEPVEAEKSGMPFIMVSAVGESPSVTPSTSTPLKPNGLSLLSVPDLLAPSGNKIQSLEIYKINKIVSTNQLISQEKNLDKVKEISFKFKIISDKVK